MTPDVSWRGLSIDATGAPPAELDRTGAVALVPAGDRAWAAGAAVTLARSLARGGRTVFLCDLDLVHPRLHDMVGVDRRSGASDFAVYGASSGHVTLQLEERLLFVSAGTPVVDREAVYASPRWESLIESAVQSRAVVLFFIPADIRGAAALLERVETVVALGDPAELPAVGSVSGRLRLGFQPQSGAPPVPADEPTDVDDLLPDIGLLAPDDFGESRGPTDEVPPPIHGGDEDTEAGDEDSGWETEAGDEDPGSQPQDGHQDPGPPPPQDEEVEADSEPAHESSPLVPPFESTPRGDEGGRHASEDRWSTGADRSGGSGTGGRRWGPWLILLLAVAAVLVAAVRMGWIDLPGMASRRADTEQEATSPERDPAGEGTAGPTQAGDPPGAPPEAEGGQAADPEPDSPPLSRAPVAAPHQVWSLRIGAYASPGVARREAATLRARVPDHVVVVAPVEVNGREWWRVISSLATDRTAAEGLRTELGAAVADATPDQWLVRRASRAFLLDETAGVAEARERAAEWSGRGIDAYVLAVPRADGSRTYRVYAGAYESATEASVMRSLLDSAGAAASLVERRGILPE